MPCDCRPRFCDFAPPHARPVDRRGRRRRRKRAAASSARAAPVATVHGRRLHNIAQVGSASPAVCLKSIPVVARALVDTPKREYQQRKFSPRIAPLRQLGEITRAEETRTGGRL